MRNQRQPGDQWYAIRWAVLERDQFACRYCGQFAPNVILHVDHVVAVCEGGTDEMDNLVTACSACNIGKEMYRARTARSQQRQGGVGGRPLNGVPSADPLIRAALGDHPQGLEIVELARLIGRERSGVLKAINRMIAADGSISVDIVPNGRNPKRLYRLTV